MICQIFFELHQTRFRLGVTISWISFSVWFKYLLKYLLSISAQIYKRANHVHSTPFYDWCESSFGTNFHVCIWRLNSIDTRTNTFCTGFRCKYRCWQVPAGVVTGVDNPGIKLNFWLTLFEVKPVSDLSFWPEIRVRQVLVCSLLVTNLFQHGFRGVKPSKMVLF